MMKVQIEIPSLEKITTENLIKFLDVFADKKAKEQDKQYAAFEYLCGIKKENLKRITYKDGLKVYEAIEKALNVKQRVDQGFSMNGVEYGMIPNIEKVSTGEYGDLDTFLTPAFAGEIKHEEAFKFLAILYRPITTGTKETTYRIKPYDGIDNWEDMKKAPASVYINAAAFFLTLRLQLLRGFRKYLNEEKEALQKQEPTLQLDGDGLLQLIDLQEITLLTGMLQLKWNFSKLLRGLAWKANKRTSKRQRIKNAS